MDNLFFNREVPIYGEMIVFGIIAALLYMFFVCKKRKLDFENNVYVFILSGVAAMLGAKILYILTSYKELILDISKIGLKNSIVKYVTGGFVFYGGLIAGIITAYFIIKHFGHKISEYFITLVPSTILVAGFGRLGCYFTGCCYGVETTSPFNVVYQHSQFAPNGMPLVPTQLYEAIFDFILFIIFVICMHKFKTFEKHALSAYLILYAIFRFIIEFFRGDEYRGIICGLSISQWISIFIFVIVLCVAVSRRKKIRIIKY